MKKTTNKVKEKPKLLSSAMKVALLFCGVGRGGGTFWQVWGPRVQLEGRFTANQYQVVLRDHLYYMMKHFYPDGSVLI